MNGGQNRFSCWARVETSPSRFPWPFRLNPHAGEAQKNSRRVGNRTSISPFSKLQRNAELNLQAEKKDGLLFKYTVHQGNGSAPTNLTKMEGGMTVKRGLSSMKEEGVVPRANAPASEGIRSGRMLPRTYSTDF